ncbi:MAG: nodulation protein NfeD [Gammaproteobacteria bacterium]|nr:nodulation protein NfeD [Gammaproteobacteria bacterium]MBU1655706.1 nodulation protein NfeD [Gammaproteobacteria bacterium]MBU1961194.1 nodulation protein NfeD [Gammaproteobacteria bacterium]
MSKWVPSWLMPALSLLVGLALAIPAGGAGKGLSLSLEGAVGPASADYVSRAIDRAEAERAELVVLRLDTPGGLDDAMRLIVKRIIAAEVPVVGYVAPGGARAASAGTYILYACHLAAMAPGTNLGAATPITLTAPPKTEKGEGQAPLADARQSKMVNDAAAYIRGLAALRGRNLEWAEKAVREAASLPAEEALGLKVIDLMAPDSAALLKALDGRQVRTAHGERTLATAGMTLEQRRPDWRSDLLSIISNPNIAYMLLLLGIYGLIYEFAHPGFLLPGTVGAIALLLALYAFQLLPVNYAGLALILLGISLMIAEAFVPSFGALGIGGITAFIFGSLILIDADQPGYGISLPLIVTVAAVSALLLATVAGLVLRARRRPVVSGAEELLGASGIALDVGSVRVHGEVWTARAGQPLRKNQPVRVTGREGLVLRVTAIEENDQCHKSM